VAAVANRWAAGRRGAIFAAALLLSGGYVALAMPVVLACWIAEVRRGARWWEPLPLDRLMFVWFALVAVSAVVSPFPAVAIGGALLLGLSAAIGIGPWLLTVRERPADLPALLGWWTLGGAAAGLYVVLSYFESPVGRGQLPALGFNAAGTSLLIASLLGLTLFFAAPQRRWRAIGAWAQIPIVAGLAATASRGAWLGWLLGLVALLPIVSLWARERARSGVVLVLAALVVGGAALATQRTLTDRLASIASFEANASRMQTWTRAIEMIEDRPLVGFGIGTFGYAFDAYRKPGDIDRYPPFAHNYFLNSAAECGIPATVASIAFLGAMFVFPLRRARHEPSHAACLRGGIAATVAGLFGQQLVDGTLQAFHFLLAYWFLYASLFAPAPGDRT